MHYSNNLLPGKHALSLAFALIVCLTTFSQRPNIVYIMTDDMGYADLGSYGQKKFSTTNLDKLAAEGVKFVNAYSAGAVCTPTRAAFMTGRYPARMPIGLLEPLIPTKRDSTIGLTRDYPSVATLLRNGGYETVLIGKWHLGYLPEHSPINNGFDYFFGFNNGANDYISHKSGPIGHRVNDLFENEKPVVVEGYLTELFAQRAVKFIKQKHTKPFFLAVTFNAPHWPWQGPQSNPYHDTADFRKQGSAALYEEMMKSLDQAVGDIIKSLDAEQLGNQTIVIFTNDNGGEQFSDHGGLSKAKASLWEGGIRVPAFVRWPGKINAGSITQQVAVTMDWTKTILSAGAAKLNESFPLDGIDLMPVLTGKQQNIERTIYWRTSQRLKQKAIRMGDWKYLQDEKGEYLFHLGNDQGEKNDLKSAEPVIFEQLKKKYADWEKTVLQPISL